MQQNTDLEKLLADYQSIIHAKKHLSNLNQRLEEEEMYLEELHLILEKEYRDVRKLESLSLGSLFHTFLGKREEQYEIEKQEYLHAVLQYNEHKKTVDLLSYEQEVLQEKLQREQEVYQQLTSLLTKRNQLIEQKYAGLKNQIIGIHKQIDEKIGYKQEVQEALSVGQNAAVLIQDMITLVVKTKHKKEWGNASLIDPGNSEFRDYTYIDEAQQISYKVKPLFQQLEDELEDVYKFKSIKRINKVAELKHFNVIYYDYLISDWIIRKQINSTLNYLYGVRDTLQRIEQTLKAQERATEQSIEYLKKRKQEIILDAAKNPSTGN